MHVSLRRNTKGFFAAASLFYRVLRAAVYGWQEELQLIMDEAIVTRFEKAGARLVAAAGPRGCADRRNPLWRQKHFRSEGVPYYSSVALFRAGKTTVGVRFGAWLFSVGGRTVLGR